MKKFFGFYLLISLFVLSVFNAEATTFKRPLTTKQYGDVYYLEWTGTAVAMASNDILALWADTANSYGNDPFYMLMANNRSSNVGPWHPYPGNHFPEKICTRVVGTAQADSTTSTIKIFWSKTKNGTFVQENTTASIIHPGTTAIADMGSIIFDPNSFFEVTVTPTSATDSLYPTRVDIYPCDD